MEGISASEHHPLEREVRIHSVVCGAGQDIMITYLFDSIIYNIL